MKVNNNLVDLSEYPKTFDLLNGKNVTLRPMEPSDRDRLFSFFRHLSNRDRRFFKHDVTQREVITNWCANLDYDRVLPILAIYPKDGRRMIVGDGTLHTERHGWSTHVAEIRLVISPRFRKLGLGRLLLRELYDLAIARGVEKIQSTVRLDDKNSQTLLRRLGFRKEATFRRHALDTNGRKHDVVVMCNELSELWHKMDDLNMDYDFNLVP